MRTSADVDARAAQDAHRPRVIHTGQALVDLVIEVADLPARGQNLMADSVAQYAGGAVTVLLAAARLGAHCLHAGAIGTGPHGDLIRHALEAEGIAASAPPVTTQDTGVCVVLVEPTAERTFVTTLGAEREITVESLSTAHVQPGDLVCITGYSLAVAKTSDPLLTWLASLPDEAVVVLDPGAAFAALPADIRDMMLARTDVWTGNAEEATDLLDALSASVDASEREIVAQARALAPFMRSGAITIVRDGAEGCAAHAHGESTYVPGFPQTPVDTNGAGDTHTGALLAGIADGATWVDACRRANAAAAIKVTRRGPTTAPTEDEVEAFLRAR
ncbi:sugar/nucleoside kinase (ribokinase family) [Microbacterium ginsengiterrae]|uniref:Sugar/nucleoside kinase (Ribokinase family) n=1 Tax=Microbacterium ginsengiterrae TaxID=546115 RepID=A0A7W9CC50_9MICO|nr:PfkB family carbohydrate kinase [Microbacterium ginsengiterrae]MBB5742880.1 sugar/nucleoside kinase (ribokinase family) [Microbacterium ginsengiterrae]